MKRASRKNKLVVGGFFVLMAAVAAVAILIFSDNLTLLKRRSRFFASFKNAAGLNVGAPIKMGGVDIGSVQSVHISTTSDSPLILLSLTVYAPYNDLMKADSVASLETQGMLGDSFLNITTGTPDAAILPAESFIPTKEKTDMSTIVTQSTDIIKTVGTTTAKLDRFVDTLPDAKLMKDIAVDFHASTRELVGLLSVLNSKDSALRLLSDRGTAQRVDDTLATLQRTAKHLESVAEKIDSGQGTAGALVNDASLYDDMRQLLGRANRSKAAKYIIQQMLDRPDEAPPVVK